MVYENRQQWNHCIKPFHWLRWILQFKLTSGNKTRAFYFTAYQTESLFSVMRGAEILWQVRWLDATRKAPNEIFISLRGSCFNVIALSSNFQLRTCPLERQVTWNWKFVELSLLKSKTCFIKICQGGGSYFRLLLIALWLCLLAYNFR